jgi:hypothetical protein
VFYIVKTDLSIRAAVSLDICNTPSIFTEGKMIALQNVQMTLKNKEGMDKLQECLQFHSKIGSSNPWRSSILEAPIEIKKSDSVSICSRACDFLHESHRGAPSQRDSEQISFQKPPKLLSTVPNASKIPKSIEFHPPELATKADKNKRKRSISMEIVECPTSAEFVRSTMESSSIDGMLSPVAADMESQLEGPFEIKQEGMVDEEDVAQTLKYSTIKPELVNKSKSKDDFLNLTNGKEENIQERNSLSDVAPQSPIQADFTPASGTSYIERDLTNILKDADEIIARLQRTKQMINQKEPLSTGRQLHSTQAQVNRKGGLNWYSERPGHKTSRAFSTSRNNLIRSQTGTIKNKINEDRSYARKGKLKRTSNGFIPIFTESASKQRSPRSNVNVTQKARKRRGNYHIFFLIPVKFTWPDDNTGVLSDEEDSVKWSNSKVSNGETKRASKLHPKESHHGIKRFSSRFQRCLPGRKITANLSSLVNKTCKTIGKAFDGHLKKLSKEFLKQSLLISKSFQEVDQVEFATQRNMLERLMIEFNSNFGVPPSKEDNVTHRATQSVEKVRFLSINYPLIDVIDLFSGPTNSYQRLKSISKRF